MSGIIAIATILIIAFLGLIWQVAHKKGLRDGDPFREYYDGIEKMMREALRDGQDQHSVGVDPCGPRSAKMAILQSIRASERLKIKYIDRMKFYFSGKDPKESEAERVLKNLFYR